MAQGDYIEEHTRLHGKQLDHTERHRKKLARLPHTQSAKAKAVHGFKAKLMNKQRHCDKVKMRKTLKLHQERKQKQKSNNDDDKDQDNQDKDNGGNAVPAYLLDREHHSNAKVLSNMLKQKRKEKAGKWTVPLPSVRAISEAELFRTIKTGKRKTKAWKRMLTKPCFVGGEFTRKQPKHERFIRPMALRMNKANVTHPQLQATFQLQIIGVKKNPSSALYTQLGVLSRGTVIEVNVSELGMVTQNGKVVWAKYAQITNNPEVDGCINAVLLV